MESHEYSTTARVDIRLELTESYSHSPVRLFATSADRFKLTISKHQDADWTPRIVACELGSLANVGGTDVASVEKDQQWVAYCTLAHAVEERQVVALEQHRHATQVTGPLQPETPSRLGVRWFPFVAANLRLQLSCAPAAVASVSLDFGPDVRVRRGFVAHTALSPAEWPGSPIPADEHASRFEQNAWTHSVWWPAHAPRELPISVPVQIALDTLGRSIYGAVFGFLAAILAVFVASSHGDKERHLITAAATAYLLLLARQWSQIPRIAHLTAMAAIYLVCGTVLVIWAVLRWHDQAWAVVLLPFLLLWALGVSLMVRHMHAHGRPPRWFVLPFWHINVWLERRRDTWRDRAQLAVLLDGFDTSEAEVSGVENEVLIRDRTGQELRVVARSSAIEVMRSAPVSPDVAHVHHIQSGAALIDALGRDSEVARRVQATLRRPLRR